MAAKKKNSLVENINRRKKAGTSRPKARTSIDGDAYAKMQAGWPDQSAKKASTATHGKTRRKKSAGVAGIAKRSAAKKTSAKKTSNKKTAKKAR